MPSAPTSSTRVLSRICLAFVIIGLLAAGYGLVRRIHAEQSSRAVDLVVEYTEVETLAETQGVPVETVLTRLRTAGATAVALPEETLNMLEDQGLLSISDRITQPMVPVSQSASAWDPSDPAFTISFTANPEIRTQVLHGLQTVYPAQNLRVYPSVANPLFILVRGTQLAVCDLGLGLSSTKIAHITNAGLRVIPRLRNIPNATPAAISGKLSAVVNLLPPAVGSQSRAIVIFDGTSVPGYRDLIPALAEELKKHALVYGSIEFGKQKGDETLGAKLRGQLVRVHSITQEELSTMKKEEVMQRFGLAVKDRNIRVLYLRFPPLTGTDPLANAVDYVKSVAGEINDMHGMGFSASMAKSAHPFIPVHVPRWLLTLLFAGGGAGVLLWLVSVLPADLPRRYVHAGYVLLALGLIGALGAAYVVQPMGRMLFGLLAAVGYPMLALTWAYRQVDRYAAQPPTQVILRALRDLCIVTGITLIGALLIAAMMGDTRFLVKVGQFSGVKFALVLPLLLLGVMVITDGVARTGETFADYSARCTRQFRAFFGQPLYLAGATIALVALAFVALMLMRSGNDSGMGVSSIELKTRAILDQWMIARPRTKEFIFGVPCFLFAMVAAANRKRALAMGLLLGAAIGQVDVLNTYCHAHTPVLLSLLRTFNGLWLGVIIGLVVLVLFARHSLRPHAASNTD